MKKYVKIIISLVSIFVSLGCDRFDDMNKNPYNLQSTTSESFVQPTLYDMEYTILRCSYRLLSELMQYTVNSNYEATAQLAYNYVVSETDTQYLWSLYKQFGNVQYMLSVAETEDNPAMVGVALVLRSLIAQIITDTYGNVPYSKAGLIAIQGDEFEFITKYDDQKSIYIDLIRSLERANSCFAKSEELVSSGVLSTNNFNSICDYMYGGDADKWRRFGNALYLRVLMRASLKVIEEDGGLLDLGEEYGEINIVSKINEIYQSFLSGSGAYPIMTGILGSARVGFSSTDSALYTPYHATTSSSWTGEVACDTFISLMNISYDAKKEDTCIFDPRLFRIFTYFNGVPTQLSREEMEDAIENTDNLGTYTRGGYTKYGHIGNLKTGSSYALLNYDEILFNFAEAGARGWIQMGQKEYKDLYLKANLESILQWQIGWSEALDYYTATSLPVVNFINYLDNEFEYENAVERILRQKYVATCWVGIESWADYRRTGYPVLKTNGFAASNNCILPTRLRYPSTEAFQNAKWYEAEVNGWLGGENNMQTDMWWASTAESQEIRRLGRK